MHVAEVGGGTSRRNVAAQVGTFSERDADQSAGDERVRAGRSNQRATAPATTGPYHLSTTLKRQKTEIRKMAATDK